MTAREGQAEEHEGGIAVTMSTSLVAPCARGSTAPSSGSRHWMCLAPPAKPRVTQDSAGSSSLVVDFHSVSFEWMSLFGKYCPALPWFEFWRTNDSNGALAAGSLGVF